MPREEEFLDIPDLGPADEERANRSIPTLEANQQVKKKSQSALPAKGRGSSPALWLLVLALAGGLGFSIYQQLQLQQQLGASEQAVMQTQSRLADVESLVNATDESSSKTGAAFLAQLKRQQSDRESRIEHVDSEIRKLWAVYQKYKPTIAELEKADEQLKQQVSSQQKELKTVGSSLDSLGVAMDKQNASVSKLAAADKELSSGTKALNSQFSQLKEDLRNLDLRQQEVDDLQTADLAEIKAKLAKAGNNNAMQALVNEHQKAIESINASRRQINAELLKLRNQLGQLQSTTTP